jgi:hypothetical protein
LKRIENRITVTCKKQKDAEEFDEFALVMKPVDLGVSEFGEPIQSCVLIDAGVHGAGLLSRHRKMLIALSQLGGRATRTDWRSSVGVPERTFDRWRDQLLALKYIEPDQPGTYKITQAGYDAIASELPHPAMGQVA